MEKTKKISLIILLNLTIVIAEIGFGLFSNSYALIADALHNAGDVLALVITYIAIILATKKTSFRFTYGFIKAETMAAFVNSLLLVLAMFFIIYEGIKGIFNPEIIKPEYMIVVGTIALIANGISAYLLSKMGVEHHHHHGEECHHHDHDLNIKSAYLHMLSDALISVGVIIAGIVIYFWNIYSIDSYLSIVFGIYIIWHSYPILKSSFFSLMDSNDMGITEEQLDAAILSDDRVLEYHDLHIHSPSSNNHHITFHIILKDENTTIKESEGIIMGIKEYLKKLGFNHIVVQSDSHQFVKQTKACVHY